MKHADGLPAKLKAFFEANPDEELTYALIVAKFDISPETAREAVGRLCREGELESFHVIRPKAKGIAK